MGYSPWGRTESDTTEHTCGRYPKTKGSRNYLLVWAPSNPTFPSSAESFPAQLSELNLGAPPGTRTGKEETRACCEGFRAETEDGSSRGGRTFPREPESHILRNRRLLTPKESRGPSSFVSITFQWQRGASLGEVPARLCGTAGPRGDSDGTNQQRLCGGWRRATFRNRCRISGCPSPHRRPTRGFLFPGLWRPSQPGALGP